MSGNPSSQVILMSYPLLSLDKPHLVKTDSGQYDASAAVRELGMKAVEHQKQLVQRLNKKYPGRVKFIEQTPAAFAGHEPDPDFDGWGMKEKTNPQRWLNEFLETEGEYKDGKIEAQDSLTYTNFWHPNIVGHREMGKLIQTFNNLNKIGFFINFHLLTFSIFLVNRLSKILTRFLSFCKYRHTRCLRKA